MFADLKDALEKVLIEREGEIKALMLGLASNEHVLLIGEPGCGKSYLCNLLCSGIEHARAFKLLLTKTTDPEEVFGPHKLSALKEDKYERLLERYAADCHIFFCDEVWKASSAIINTKLTLMEERQIDNGGRRIDCPLLSEIAASNEWPTPEEHQELGAAFDRFLIRKRVRGISMEGRMKLITGTFPKALNPVCTLDDVKRAHADASALPVAEDTLNALSKIGFELAQAGIKVGERRWQKGFKVARAEAYLEGAAQVEPHHLEVLRDVYWATPEQADQADRIITTVANPVGQQLNDLLKQADEIVQDANDTTKRMAANSKLEEIEQQVKKLCATGNGRAKKVLQRVKSERAMMQAMCLGISPEKAKKLMQLQED